MTHRAAAAPPAWTRLGTASRWPVAVILAAQAALSLRLMWRDGAAPAEAAYLNSWRLDPGHWLPGAAGLTAGRLLSLTLMLTATTLLHGTTRRLYDRRSAFFAAALFAGLAGTAFLGAFASGDAMSAALLATAAWLGIQAAGRRGAAQPGLAAAAGAVLALAIATGYGAGLAGPAGLGLTTLAVWRTCGARAAARAGAAMGASLAGVLGALVLATGPARGAWATALLRGWLATGTAGAGGPATAAGAGSPAGAGWPASLLTGGSQWLVVLALLAVAGALIKIAARQGWPVSAMSALLAAAALGIPAESARAAAGAWLAVPSCCGAWLGCVIAGYGVASLARAVPRAKSAAAFGVGLGLVVLAAIPGVGWAGQQVSWPRPAPVVNRVQAVLAGHAGPVLTDSTGDLLRLYLGASLARRALVQADMAPAAPGAGAGPGARATAAGTRTGPAAGLAGPGSVRQCDLAACQDAIARHRFAVIVLSLWHAGPASYQLQRAVVLAGYRRVAPVTSAGGEGGAAPGTGDGPWNIWVRAARP
ncbi:MAG TPA: glycosyltransferase family 39 protein [Streptosporangiaceae bacterium]|nr:glycosyltransferase family 39 protein [Streptosporangiaceae bacterium]